jgi:hypothetical protein
MRYWRRRSSFTEAKQFAAKSEFLTAIRDQHGDSASFPAHGDDVAFCRGGVGVFGNQSQLAV